MSRARRLACVITAIAVVGIWSAASPAAGAAAEKPRNGGKLTVLVSSDITPNLDAAKITSTPGGMAAQLLYSSLISVDPVTQQPVMHLAQSLTSNSALTVWTLKLRKGLVFSDGTPLDAAAVVSNWNRHMVPAVVSICSSIVAGLTSYVAQDPTTVVITLPEARVAFPTQVAGCLGWIQSPAAVDKFGASIGTSPETTVGAGPYILKEWVRGSQATFVRNPTYWDKPRPYVDTIVQMPVRDPAQQLTTFQTGQADLLFSASGYKGLSDTTAAMGGTLWGYYPAGGAADVAFNLSAPGLDDVRIRKALVLATDPKDLNLKATGGVAPMLDTFFEKGTPQYNAKVRQVTGNLAKAQKLVDAYVAEKGPLTLTFSLVTTLAAWGEAQLQQWSRLNGITIKEELVQNGGALLASGNFQMAVTSIAGGDPESLYNQMYSTARGNVIHYKNPTVDAALTQLRGEKDPQKQHQLYTTISKEWLNDAPVVYWYRPLQPVAVRKGISGMEPFTYVLPDLANVWIAKG